MNVGNTYLKFWITRWTSLSLMRLRQNSAAAKPNQMLVVCGGGQSERSTKWKEKSNWVCAHLTKMSLDSEGGRLGATHWRPTTTPNAPPHEEKSNALGSMRIFWYRIVNAAQFMPTLCVISDMSGKSNIRGT
jgi:hypothetical protein